jgi:hypothetical protein
MKQFLAFYGSNYYPSGGMSDFMNDFDTLEEAIIALEKNEQQNRFSDQEPWEFRWGQIYDTEKRDIVWTHDL